MPKILTDCFGELGEFFRKFETSFEKFGGFENIFWKIRKLWKIFGKFRKFRNIFCYLPESNVKITVN